MKMINIFVTLALLFSLGISFAGGSGSKALNARVNENLKDAAFKGDIIAVQRALAAGADVNYYSIGRDFTALTGAAMGGHLNIINLLLDNGAHITAHALVLAAMEGHLNVIKLLLSRGADVNATNSAGATALMYAAESNQQGMVNFLLSAGANVNATDGQGRTALNYARNNDVHKILRDFIDKLNKDFLDAARTANRPALQKTIKRFVDIDTQDERGNTALHLLAGVTKRRLSDNDKLSEAALMTQKLLSKGAIIKTNNDGESPIDIAMTYPDSVIVEVYKKFAKTHPDIKKAFDEAVQKHEQETSELRKAAEAAGPQEGYTMTDVIAEKTARKERSAKQWQKEQNEKNKKRARAREQEVEARKERQRRERAQESGVYN